MARLELFFSWTEEDNLKTSVRYLEFDPAVDDASFFTLLTEQISYAYGEQQFSGLRDESLDFAVSCWLRQAFEILLKIRGYRAESVNEERQLWTGNLQPDGSYELSNVVDDGIGIANALRNQTENEDESATAKTPTQDSQEGEADN